MKNNDAFIRGNDSRRFRNVLIPCVESGYPYGITVADLAQAPKERVPVRRQSDVAVRAWKSRSRNMTDLADSR
jgi:hypothetical protein